MSLSKFFELKSLSNLQIFNALKESEKKIFNLKCNKITGQNFKSHNLNYKRYYLAQLKMILTLRLIFLHKKQTNNLQLLLENNIYIVFY